MSWKHHLLPLIGCCLLFVLTACQKLPTSSTTSASSTQSVVSSSSPSVVASASPTSKITPADCSHLGTSYPAVLTKTVININHSLIYTYNLNSQDPTHNVGTLFRYDTTNGSKTEIATFPQSNLGEAQLSADGQWILFLHQQELQIVRLDGKELQTVYCVPKNTSLSGLTWSPDQQTVAFSESTQQPSGYLYVSTLKLLHLDTGKLEVAVTQQKGDPLALPAKWLDNTHLYLYSRPQGVEALPGGNIYLLDLTKKLPQSLSQLSQLLVANKPFFDFATSSDNSKLYISHCVEKQGLPLMFTGPSSVTVQPALGGIAQTILRTQMAVTSVHAISPTTLLLIVNQTLSPGDQNTQELANNGIWKMNTDGTGLALVWHSDGLDLISFDKDTQGTPSQTSAGNQYVIKITKDNGDQLLGFGSLSDNNMHIFAQTPREERIDIVGWTTP